MKKLIAVLVLAAAFSACQSSNSPETTNSAIMPNAGSEYMYSVAFSSGTIQETARVTYSANDSFTVARTSDTLHGFSTTGIEYYVVRPTGDLFCISSEPMCDSIPLPIASHRTFSIAQVNTPTKKNGYVYDSSGILFQTSYDGEETLSAAGTSFDCAAVNKVVNVIAASGQANGGADTAVATHRYWYSSQLGFFVKDLETNRMNGTESTVFTRTLVSYQLAK